MPIHQTGKLLLTTANVEVIRSITEPTLLPASAPKNIPIIEIIMVAVVNNKTVLGIFSRSISPTLDEPESLVRNVAFPKSSINILYIVNPILCGEYHGLSSPSVLIRSSICVWTNCSNSSTVAKLSAMAGFSVISAQTW